MAARWRQRPAWDIFAAVGLNVVVWLLWAGRRRQGFMRRHFTVSGANLRAGRVYTVITAAFSHEDAMHLAHNMVCLSQSTPHDPLTKLHKVYCNLAYR